LFEINLIELRLEKNAIEKPEKTGGGAEKARLEGSRRMQTRG